MNSDCNQTPNILIRKFSTEDYNALIKLWNDSRLPYKPKGRDSKDKIEFELKRGNALFLVAEINGKLVGSILGTHDGRKGWINRLAVAPEYQMQGIARRLVDKVEGWLHKLGISIIACLVEDWNMNSKKFFESLGYNMFADIVYFTKKRYPDI